MRITINTCAIVLVSALSLLADGPLPLRLVAPGEGATVPLLPDDQKGFLDMPRAEWGKAFADAPIDMYGATADLVCAYTDRVRNAPQKRGVMLPARPCTENDFKTLHDWGATLARYQMCADGVPNDSTDDLPAYRKWLRGKLDHLERDVLPWARKYNIEIVVDMHFPPGYRRSGDDAFRMFYDDALADAFVDCWREIARRFAGASGIYGYDLMNEPVEILPGIHGHRALYERAARAIRAIDPTTPIIFESNLWDGPELFLCLEPYDITNAIYEVHMYRPTAYTHQGVGKHPTDLGRWPDSERGWNADFLRATLAPVRTFEKKYNAKIYVGEFSASIWADGAENWLRDCIDLFREYGWDWTYHAFREWPGWSVEHEPTAFGMAPDCFRPSADNPRKRALMKALRGTIRNP